MNWETIQQMLRILAYAGGSAVFGADIADGQLYQGALGGLIAVGAFVWWAVWERKRVPTVSE